MFHDNILLVILIVKKLLERFAKMKCQKKRKKSQKVSMRKGDKLYGNSVVSVLVVRLMKKQV